MAAEENKKFDAVLGGFLVNDLRVRAGDLHCPESDTLAAYHERSLLPEEMNSWKEHIVGCACCQAILAELEATDSIPLQVTENEEAAVGAVALPAAVVGQADNPTTATLPAKSRVTPISRGVRWQWLAAAGAIAAGLLVWVVWHENRSQLKAPAEIKTAKLEPPAAPMSPVPRDDRQALPADESGRVPKDQGAISRAAAAKPARGASGMKQLEKSDLGARVPRSEPQADKEARARADATLDSLSAANLAQNRPAQDAKAGVAGAASESAEVQALTANAQELNRQAQQNLQAQQNQLNEQKPSGPNPSKHLERARKSKVESPEPAYRAAAAPPAGPPPPVPAPATAFNEDAALRFAGAITPHVIASPNRKILWRTGHAGMIEFSNDGGVSWSRQISNVSAELTGGSAPSEKVCWIIGQAGTILLTADAGAHWMTIHSPLDEDLGGARATDVLHATIWNLGNTKVLETSDGGVTWKTATSQ